MRERVRGFLGVWAPMILGLALVAVAVNFLVAPRPPPGGACEPFCLDASAAAACGGFVILVGLVLVLSTVGRWRKVRRARG